MAKEIKDIEKSDIPEDDVSITAQEDEDIVSDQMLLGIYSEILDNVRQDRSEIDEYLGRFADMVINEGDATTSSKEAVVNLIKMKTDQSDKMSKIADLMTRVKMKEKDVSKFITKQNGDVINIGNNGPSKRALLEQIEAAAEKSRRKENDSQTQS